ncbi:hypothetical protein Tco_0874530 [Tanacetum coccineum]|uniref:Uncharacterized protein n=1 Tax=Tanacetum coccineum TaxID=301880 RepID=A0ABQ5BR35_9ASTR
MLVPPFQFHLLVITMEDPKSSSNPFKSVNAIKTRFKSTNALPKDQQQLKTLTVDEIETLKLKEPEKALEYEFKDLHLNLPVLEILAHAPKYNSLLDKYTWKKDHMCPLLVGRGFVATASAILDCKKSKIAVGEEITMSMFGVKEVEKGIAHGEWEIDMDVDLNPFKDILVFRKIVEFLGAILINLKGNMWESEDMIEKKRIGTSHQKK